MAHHMPGVVAVPGKPIHFRVRREGWNRYEVFGGEIEVYLRQLVVLVSETQAPDGGLAQPVVLGPVVNTTWAEEKWRGKPTLRPPTPDELRSGRHVDAVPVEEVVSEYVAIGSPERVFTLRIVPTEFRLVRGWHDQSGFPAVTVDSNTVLSRLRPLELDEAGV